MKREPNAQRHGHPEFYRMTQEELTLHDQKNKDLKLPSPVWCGIILLGVEPNEQKRVTGIQ